ncbi:MAG: ABC transporter permease subunit [Opitutus sp.]
MSAQASGSPAAACSPRRVGLIAHSTLREAARQKLFHALLLLAFGLVLGAGWFRDFNFGAPELVFLADCGFGATSLFGSVLAVTATAQLFFSEIESRTVLTLLAKPVGRTEFILGKFLGLAVVLLVFCALLTVLLIGVLWSRETVLMQEFPEAFGSGRRVDYAMVALAGTLQWLKLMVLSSLTLLVASFARTQMFTVIAGFSLLVICHLQPLAQESHARGGSVAGRLIGGLVAPVFPNFQIFTLADSIGAEPPAAGDVMRVVIYALGYTAVACLLAGYSFRRREL